MRRVVRAVLLAACVGACGGGGGGAAAAGVPGAAATVAWHVGATNVQTTIEAGSSVAWRSSDGMAHTVTSGSTPAAFGELAVPANGSAVMIRFDTPGTYPYFCSIHGAQIQNGTVTVIEAQ
jgi:plastocyanin